MILYPEIIIQMHIIITNMSNSFKTINKFLCNSYDNHNFFRIIAIFSNNSSFQSKNIVTLVCDINLKIIKGNKTCTSPEQYAATTKPNHVLSTKRVLISTDYLTVALSFTLEILKSQGPCPALPINISSWIISVINKSFAYGLCCVLKHTEIPAHTPTPTKLTSLSWNYSSHGLYLSHYLTMSTNNILLYSAKNILSKISKGPIWCCRLAVADSVDERLEQNPNVNIT